MWATSRTKRGTQRLKIAAAGLLGFDGLEQRLEVAFAESPASFSLNDLVKQRRTILHRFGKDLKEVPLLIAVDKDSEIADGIEILRDLADTRRQHVVIDIRNAQELDSLGAQFQNGRNHVLGLQRNVLHARSAVGLQILVDLALALAGRRLVKGKFDGVRIVGHDNRHQGAVLGRDVLVVEADEAMKSEDAAVVLGPVVHLAEFNITDHVIDAQNSHFRARNV